ncbi:hypothetical protein [Allocoleopsis franciscana]|uniref:Uncharacterized protein n=1 Tax=Allocoleopsis franciscana PCC 7113 TaxID=1173027 RepID=K9WMQ1_9CYAN|nr:hypothetical protein [Allocoleopsis franciscana]AFZ20827.1 hypothetical protein Mic7113_5171 [Allocoleopsis franciscana PCC 7113]
MKTQWKKLFVKTTVWLAAEIILNLIGLDNLADYSEFIYEQEVMVLSQYPQPTTLIIA